MSRPRVELKGLLGRALAANHAGRLSHFITSEHSPAIVLFDPMRAASNVAGDWYGEHAGKWLVAAAKAAQRTGDAVLTAAVRRVAAYLVEIQRADGYLGTYAPERQFTIPPAPPQRTWDGAPAPRTWDIWTHTYLILGLLEVHKHFPDAKYLDAARRIGELCRKAFVDDGIDITHLGNHHGMSATVLLDATVELFLATGEQRFLALSHKVLEQADSRPELNLLQKALAGVDAAEIGTGKAYQLIWNLIGLAKLYRADGDKRLLDAVVATWTSIRNAHLTLGGGPWGGAGLRSREVFNPRGVFSPRGYVETCSTFSWIQLNRTLLEITGEARFAEQIEVAAYNDLLGAQAPNGEDWCYYSFPNGKRVFTTYWRCCKSSGAMALEELPEIAYRVTGNAIDVNLYGASDAVLEVLGAGLVRIEQRTEYPRDGVIELRIAPEETVRFTIRVRIPAWADGATVRVNGVASEVSVAPDSFVALQREWRSGDVIALNFPMQPMLRHQSNRNLQQSVLPDGSAAEQEVLRYDYVAITRGPLVYATELVDGFKVDETIRLPAQNDEPLLEIAATPEGFEGPAIRFNLDGRAPLLFVPYFEAGGRSDGAWRLTWMQVAPQILNH